MRHKTGTKSLALLVLLLSAGCGPGTDNLSTGGSDAVYETAVTLAWEAPTTNTDDSLLTDLSGYTLYYGPSPGYYTRAIDAGDATSYTLTDIPPGSFCFSVRAYDGYANESPFSPEVLITIPH